MDDETRMRRHEVGFARSGRPRTKDDPALDHTTRVGMFELGFAASGGPDQTSLERQRLIDQFTWKTIDTGLNLAQVARVGDCRIVLFHIAKYAPKTIWKRHRHPAGEFTHVIFGSYQDENGVYTASTSQYSDPDSVHSPEPTGEETLLLVFWPAKVEILDD